jgi:SAM-dependent methyltransferase
MLSKSRPKVALEMANPMDNLADQYDEWFDSSHGHDIFEIELHCVQKFPDVGKGRWLEAGVGTGRFAAALGVSDGIDPSQTALDIAERRGIRTQLGYAEQLPYQDAVFDGVLMIATFCFLADPCRSLQECRRVMKAGGAFILAIIPADSSWGRFYAEKGKAGHPFYSIATFHTCDETIALANKAGFELVDSRSCLLSPPQEPLTFEIRPGIVRDAGFVCMMLLNPL